MFGWEKKFMELAFHIATWSKEATKVGCVIVGPYNEIRATGYNGFPRGITENILKRNNVPEKYLWSEHAERNAIFNAARIGTSIDKCQMYLSWFPCMDCGRALIQSGISELISVEPNLKDPQWGYQFQASKEILDEAGIKIRFFDLLS